MSLKAVTFICIVLCSQVNSLPFSSAFTEQDLGYSPRLFWSNYGYSPNGPATYVQYQADPVTGEQVPIHHVTHMRHGGLITTLIQNCLNKVGRFVGDVGGAFGNALGDTLIGAGLLGQDIIDFINRPPSIK